MNALGIVRLGLVQTALGAVVVLMTATLNRVMIVELALPAIVSGLMVALFHVTQIMRPVWGHGSDVGGRRGLWIVAGMATLCLGGVIAAAGVALGSRAGLALAAFGFLLVGSGAGAAGTNVLATLAAEVAPARRAAAATTVWVMMILGFALTAPLAGRFLDPYSPARLLAVVSVVSALSFVLACLALAGLKLSSRAAPHHKGRSLREALATVWAEPEARGFTGFIFVSMLAYSAQELLVEPYAGLVFGLSPGVTTGLAGMQHGGTLIGMILVAALASGIGGVRLGDLRLWTVGGCGASACALVALALCGLAGEAGALKPVVFALGVGNGIYAAAAIGSMMGLAGRGAGASEGVRMGIWGAAQALAMGLGGLVGAGLVDAARLAFGAALPAYAFVFAVEAAAFLLSAWIAAGVGLASAPHPNPLQSSSSDGRPTGRPLSGERGPQAAVLN